MTGTRTPYQDTSVPVSRSQSAIRDLLKDAGADGVQFEEVWAGAAKASVEVETGESWTKQEQAVIRFLWTLGKDTDHEHTERIRFIVPRLPEYINGVYKTPEQRERQAWRSVYWYLKSAFEAVVFSRVMAFEDVFLSFVEGNDGRTIGEVVIPQLEAGRLALPRGDA